MDDTTSLRKQILPFKKSMKDIRSNFWHLRTFFLLIFFILVVSGSVFYFAENSHFSQTTRAGKVREIIFITANDVLPVSISDYVPRTSLGKLMSIINSLCGFVLLGFFIWIIQRGLHGQKIKKSKLLFFSTEDDA